MGVCERHFQTKDFCSGANSRGKERTRRRLKNDAVPSVFDSPRTGQSAPRTTLLATPSARRLKREENEAHRVETFLAEDRIKDIDDLRDKLLNETIPAGFR